MGDLQDLCVVYLYITLVTLQCCQLKAFTKNIDNGAENLIIKRNHQQHGY